MSLNQILLLVIVGLPLLLVGFKRLRVDQAALSMAAALGVLQFAGLEMLGPAHSSGDSLKAFSGFSQPVVITLISLLIVSRGLEKSGTAAWIARRVIALSRQNESLTIGLLTLASAFLSLFMNNVAAGALVLPGALQVAQNTRIPPGRLLIPVAYGSLLGGMATYFTTANIIMSDLLPVAQPPQAALHILDFTPTGGLIAIGGILFLATWGKRLLPASGAPQPIISEKASLNPAGVTRLQSVFTVAFTLAGILASIAGVPVYLAMFGSALLITLIEVVPLPEAYRVIEWQVIFLIVGMYAVSLAFVQTGLAALLARGILFSAQQAGGLGLCAAAYLLAVIINQFIGGQVTAYVVGPVALSAAISLGINPQAIAVATAIGCSTSFLTPIAHPVNLIMLAPGGYRFSDFVKAGWPLTLLCFGLLLAGLKLFWGL